MNDQPPETAAAEAPATATTVAGDQQVAAKGNARALSLVAIVLFIFFVLTRRLDWATFHVDIHQATGTPIAHHTGISGNHSWHDIGTPLILCAIALIPINFVFMFSEGVLDPLAPALANCVVAAVLIGASIYFIANVNDIMGGTTGESVTLSYEAARGAYAALLIAVLLFIVGLLQLRTRLAD